MKLEFGISESKNNPELIRIKSTLNKTKSKLDKYEERARKDPKFAKKYRYFNMIIDIYKPMRNIIIQLSGTKHVTNAWMKYYELINSFDLIPQEGKFKAFFNAELPGAALCSVNYFIQTRRPNIDWMWWASSYIDNNSTGSTILGDYYGLYSHNKDHWVMDETNNGDARSLDNLQDIANKLGPRSPIGGVDLYSHDAGIDVSNDYLNQEVLNAHLHLGCALGGFMILKPGGSFIAKQYTSFEEISWNLILIYAGLFKEFYLCKPFTSRPNNSEIYLVGKGFLGMPDNIYQILSDKLQNFNDLPLLMNPIPSEILEFSREVFNRQAKSIDKNISYFEKYRDLSMFTKSIKKESDACIKIWLDKYPILKITKGELPSKSK